MKSLGIPITNETLTSNVAIGTIQIWWKPTGRARRYDRLTHALGRRLRLPWVRRVRWEYQNPQAQGRALSYSHHWSSNFALADTSFACTCHKRPRYSRKGRKR